MSEPTSDHQGIDVSIIIVTYNNEKEIEPCLRSIAMQQGDLQCEIILIDNASNDLTRTRMRRSSAALDHVHFVFNTANYGFTRAINQGLACSNGSYLLLLNPDVELSAGSLSKLISKIKVQEHVGIVSPQFLGSDNMIQPSCRRFPRRRDVWYHAIGLPCLFKKSREFNGWKMGDFDHRSEIFVDQPQGAFLLTSRDAFEKIGPLDESFPMFFSDVDWCRRFKQQGYEILFTPITKIVHHQGRSIFQRRLPLIWSSHRSFYHYFRKYDSSLFAWLLTFVTGLLLLEMAIARSLLYFITPKNQ
ncbi:glycosyltransferase family 2 protein [candidate division KSB1 bacterium]|nr:glycosyltransferase family 2 protein [candidate division KSB1 bacterium]